MCVCHPLTAFLLSVYQKRLLMSHSLKSLTDSCTSIPHCLASYAAFLWWNKKFAQKGREAVGERKRDSHQRPVNYLLTRKHTYIWSSWSLGGLKQAKHFSHTERQTLTSCDTQLRSVTFSYSSWRGPENSEHDSLIRQHHYDQQKLRCCYTHIYTLLHHIRTSAGATDGH